MIIVRSPLRITLGGGGTDLPSYYRKYGGFLIAGSINKYVYISINTPFENRVLLKYSSIEKRKRASEIQHPIVREILKYEKIKERIEITSVADIPSGTGLGSSGSFTTALIRAIYEYQNKIITKQDLAEYACDIEINKLKQPIGKQDQYAASFGGLTAYTFNSDDSVDVERIQIDKNTIYELDESLLLFYTGKKRSAGKILKDQNLKSKKDNPSIIDNLHKTKDMGKTSLKLLQKGELDQFALLMHQHWMNKLKRSKGMSNNQINIWYQHGLDNGALGGKVVGAGGGGFLMFYAKDKVLLRNKMKKIKLPEVRFTFDSVGTDLICK